MSQDAVIKYRKWNHRKLSRSVGIIHQPNKNRLNEILQTINLDSDGITLSKYKISCAERFTVDYPSISAAILEVAKDSGEIRSYKESLFSNIVVVNRPLDPSRVYITPSNTLSLTRTDFPLVECGAWHKKDDPQEQLIDPEVIHLAGDRAEACHYTLFSERWKVVGITVQVRQYRRSDRIPLVLGFEPKSTEHKKLYFVALCVDNFLSVRNYLSTYPETADIPFKQIVNDLYTLVLKHNPWTRMNLTEIRKINQDYSIKKTHSVGTSPTTETKFFKSLSRVPGKKISDLEQSLKEVVFGQDEAIEAICNRVRKAYAGLKMSNYPIGVFFFFGPTSVGKTELPRQLAEHLMGSKASLIKIDCNTLQQDHEITFLLGAPPSYVGYEDGGILAGQMEDSQFKVIMFDEVEKATPKIFDLVLTFIDEGQAIDKRGNLLDFSDCIFVFTSNLGQQEANDAIVRKIGFNSGVEKEDDDKILKKEFDKILKKRLKPEFVSRVKSHGGIFYFGPLNRENLIGVAKKYLGEMTRSILENGNIELIIDEDLPGVLVDYEMDKNPRCHARDVITAIEVRLFNKLADEIIQLASAGKKDKRFVLVNKDLEITVGEV